MRRRYDRRLCRLLQRLALHVFKFTPALLVLRRSNVFGRRQSCAFALLGEMVNVFDVQTRSADYRFSRRKTFSHFSRSCICLGPVKRMTRADHSHWGAEWTYVGGQRSNTRMPAVACSDHGAALLLGGKYLTRSRQVIWSMKQRPDVKLVSVPQFDLEARKASAPGCGETPRELTMLRSNWLHPSLPRTSSRLTVRWTRRLEAQLRN